MTENKHIVDNFKTDVTSLDQCEDVSCMDLSSDKPSSDFPPDRIDIGRSTWKYLHTLAARYPLTPNEDDKLSTQAWIVAFSNVYPCKHCRTALVKKIKEKRPNVNNRNGLVRYMCELHNAVNHDLGMKTFPCNVNELIKMYK